MKLGTLADIVRSKNAGIHYVTIDIMFTDASEYRAVKGTGILTASLFADRYGIDEEDVRFFEYDPGQAFKVTIPRSVSTGAPRDRDLYGAQQHVPVLDIEIPLSDD